MVSFSVQINYLFQNVCGVESHYVHNKMVKIFKSCQMGLLNDKKRISSMYLLALQTFHTILESNILAILKC